MQIPKLLFPASIFQIVIISLLFIVLGCGQEPPLEGKKIIRPVKYFEINPAGRDSNIEYSGKITAVQEVFMAFEVSGKINNFPVKEGERVKKGAVLSRLDDRDFRTALESRMADLNAAKAHYERARDLYENNTISKRDLDVARRNYEVARAGVKTARKSLDDTRLVAPFSGLVAKTLVENYQNIQAKEPILILQDDSSLEMIVDIPERDYARVDKTMSLSELTRILKPEILLTSFPDKRFKARFKEAAATADAVTRTFEITLGFQAPSNISILPGMTARLVITGSMQKEGSTVMIPAKALLSDDNNQPTVWLIDASSNAVKRHTVEIGEMSGENIEIIKGLKTGDIIAGSGGHQLREGMIVRKYEKP
jgi:RND family efflux transporter MFP subunit